MSTQPQHADLERQHADLLRQAAQIVEAADASSRNLTAEEDARVLELTKQAHIIEEDCFV